ncbi:parkin coregulated gene protein-like isoform X2 [Phymastichus coffea]|uniref:parkin coregulated gene protein-like isoform X2 n=1 Tax=Phymastichus coffea TaxID=108790 RepID=UPI00273BE32E|nr:parkin coregulated gene protein-like isoform X2 [Phymastichus coffea]
MVNQSEFWGEVRKHRYGKHRRVVPAFTIQALQANTVVARPPKCGLFEERPAKTSTFRRYYERGMFPIALEADASGGQKISWKVDLDKLDYQFYLPLFFDGLTEAKVPYSFIVEQAILEMLDVSGAGVQVLPCLPQLVMPIKRALDTKIPEVICRTLRILQRLVRCGNCIGEALVPYFRQILPVFSLLKDRNVNYGEGIDYSQQRGENVADLIQETLEVLEQYGGEDAFINIKYMVPTYESCTRN